MKVFSEYYKLDTRALNNIFEQPKASGIDMQEVGKILNTPGFKAEYDEDETDINKIREKIFANASGRKKKKGK
jgi:hypothetical protein